jgi:hypothetical protein
MKTAAQLIADKKHKEVISIAPNRPVIDAPNIRLVLSL